MIDNKPERRARTNMNDAQRVALGAALRTAREAQGLSIRQVAALLEVAPSQALRWETGERPPTPQNLVDLAQRLELRASDLFALAGIPVPADAASLPAMLRSEYELPPEAIAEVQKHIESVANKYRVKQK
jgi:transcriptional regulator with XRE-family HTH domain